MNSILVDLFYGIKKASLLKNIIVTVTNDLVTDQRVHKVCTSLNKAGYNVTLIGRFLKNSSSINRDYRTKRMRLFFNVGFLFYAEFNLRLFFKVLFLKKDILVANDLDTLLPCYLISVLFRKKIVYDSHELFTEVPELVNRPKTQKIWLALENKIVPKLANCITVCDSISAYYKAQYDTSFHVIKNVPENIVPKPSKLPFEIKNKKIILYQGALNAGRGLELIIETMLYLQEYLLVIIGSGDLEKVLEEKVRQHSLESKVLFMGKIAPNKLKGITPYADLGISLEEDLGLNYRYALPNKIFDYIHGKVPCLVSDLPEMKNLVLSNNFGTVIESRKPKRMAKQITAIFNDSKRYNIWLENLNKPNTFNWDVEHKKIISLFKNLT